MNWMRASLNRWRANTLLLGAIAGIWASLFHQLLLWLTSEMAAGALPSALVGMAFGAGMCGGLASAEDLINRCLKRALKSAFFGAVLGIVAGGVSFVLLETLVTPAARVDVRNFAPEGIAPWLGIPPIMGLVGAAAGLAAGYAAGRGPKALRRMAAGAGTGVVAGIPLALVLAFTREVGWVMPLAFAGWGAAVAFGMFWGERRFARRWLRVLTGPGEDNFYPLSAPWITMGKLESNDIPLLDYQEVFPYHCRLQWQNGHYRIVDGEQGGTVLVNYRQINDQALKSGDLVKIGSALLQYGEAQ